MERRSASNLREVGDLFHIMEVYHGSVFSVAGSRGGFGQLSLAGAILGVALVRRSSSELVATDPIGIAPSAS